MVPFTYYRADSLADALARIGADAQAKLLAGGMTLLPSMKHHLAAPTQLIDLARLPELRGVSADASQLTIGAAMRHREVADHATVRERIPALAELAGCIGDPQVRARGTLGGSLANNDPAADYPAGAMGLDALIVTDRRRIAAADYFQGMFATALEPDEIVVAVSFQIPRRAGYGKFAHPATGYAMAGVFVADLGAAGIRVAVTGAAPGVFRWAEAEAALGADFSVAAVAALPVPGEDMNEDLHASAAYRANLVRVMTIRTVARITGQAAGH